MKFFLIAAFLAAASAASLYAPTAYSSNALRPEITIVRQSDLRNPDGSSQWSYELSDGTTREESQVQKLIGTEMGNTNRGSTSFITPEGQRIALNWVADENGFQPKGDHLPIAPAYTPEVAAVWATVRPPTYSASAYAAPTYAAPTYAAPSAYRTHAYVAPVVYRAPAVSPAPALY